MGLREYASAISWKNDYTALKWPLTIASVLTTVLALIILLSFRSDAWFNFELSYQNNDSSLGNTQDYIRAIGYGSFGLWRLCGADIENPEFNCQTWTKIDRPHSFNVVIVLLSCGLFFANLTVFPSWAATILILYNTNNRYIRHIVSFVWILFILTLIFTGVLAVAVTLASLTNFYSPGRIAHGKQIFYFYSGSGFIYAGFATLIAIACLVLVIITLIWKKFIEMEIIEAEKELLRQISDDGFRPGWHRIVNAPRSPLVPNDGLAPPPYDLYSQDANTREQ